MQVPPISIPKKIPVSTVGAVGNPAKKHNLSPWIVPYRDRLKEWGWSVPRLAKEMGRGDDSAFIDRLYKILQGRVEQPRGRLLMEIDEALKIHEIIGKYRTNRLGRTVLRDDLSSEDIAAGGRELRSEDVAAALPGPALRKTVKLKGYVGAGSEAHFYKIADEDFEEVPAPRNATDQTVAVQIRGKSWGPAMDTWLVFYDDVRSPIDQHMIGKPCILGLSDDRILLKIPHRQPNGLFRLTSNSDEPPIEDAEIEWAALVTGMAPRT